MKEHDELVDIREIRVDGSLSREERIAEFVRQIKIPIALNAASLPSGFSIPRTALLWRTV